MDVGKIVEDADLRDRTGVFADRMDAGRRLGGLMRSLTGLERAVVFAIPSGGVPIGMEVAQALSCQMRVAVVRKVHVPWNPEAGFGSVAWDGRVIIDEELAARLGIGKEEIQHEVESTRRNVQERMEKFGGDNPDLAIEGKDAVITDDGLAAGY
ncbi:MAG TPA: phosphoribosyltransferase, partial [Methanomicrobiales archaeon]|nr:phosphoribosyltransferase [Methanomicrobiales archaeon]